MHAYQRRFAAAARDGSPRHRRSASITASHALLLVRTARDASTPSPATPSPAWRAVGQPEWAVCPAPPLPAPIGWMAQRRSCRLSSLVSAWRSTVSSVSTGQLKGVGPYSRPASGCTVDAERRPGSSAGGVSGSVCTGASRPPRLTTPCLRLELASGAGAVEAPLGCRTRRGRLFIRSGNAGVATGGGAGAGAGAKAAAGAGAAAGAASASAVGGSLERCWRGRRERTSARREGRMDVAS
mmetsp:Transcript_4843/g.15732  ORF Transcript_4843/g.15732 Transcript_4843/m.15732 type:complete len:240 (-) Transcript_4843:71-790(-)